MYASQRYDEIVLNGHTFFIDVCFFFFSPQWRYLREVKVNVSEHTQWKPGQGVCTCIRYTHQNKITEWRGNFAVCSSAEDLLLCWQPTRLLANGCIWILPPLRGFYDSNKYGHCCCQWSSFNFLLYRRSASTGTSFLYCLNDQTKRGWGCGVNACSLSPFSVFFTVCMQGFNSTIQKHKSKHNHLIPLMFFFPVYFPVLTSIGWFACLRGRFTVVCVVAMA